MSGLLTLNTSNPPATMIQAKLREDGGWVERGREGKKKGGQEDLMDESDDSARCRSFITGS